MRLLLLSIVITIFSYDLALAYEVGDCTERAPNVRSLSGEVVVNSGDWSWIINRQNMRVELEIFNSSRRPIRKVSFTETVTGSVSVFEFYIEAGGRESISFAVSSEVSEMGENAQLKAFEYAYQRGACIDLYTEGDRERDLTFNNCVVSKTVNGGSIWAARNACNIIADDPSFWDKVRFGS
jgi:hypothetical protein